MSDFKELEIEFSGKGEVKGYEFKQIEKTGFGYVYEVVFKETGQTHYEVFLRRENELYQTVTYPSSKTFGKYAWCIKDKEKAILKLYDISKNEVIKLINKELSILG